MTVNEWLCRTVQGLVDFPEMVSVTEHPLGDTIYLQVSAADSDVGKIVGYRGSGWRALRDLTFIRSKQDGRKYFLEARIATNQGTDAPAPSTERRLPSESDPGAIAAEFLLAHNLTPDTMSRTDVPNLIRWAEGDVGEVRAYMLAQFGESMRADAVAALRNG